MEQAIWMKLLAAILVIGTFLYGATTDQILNVLVAFGIAGVASIGIWMQPPTDYGDWKKLANHLLLSLPIAGLAVIAGTVVYSSAGGFDLTNAVGVFVLVFVPANALEQWWLNHQ